jgi:predicted nucleic acid-binding protein
LSAFVLDASVTLAWFFDDEFDRYADEVAEAMQTGALAVAPPLWSMETANAVLKAERRGRLTKAKADEIVLLLKALPISFDDVPASTALNEGFALARTLDRSAYDAMYFELCVRRGLPLASLDSGVRQAAKKAGVRIFLQ